MYHPRDKMRLSIQREIAAAAGAREKRHHARRLAPKYADAEFAQIAAQLLQARAEEEQSRKAIAAEWRASIKTWTPPAPKDPTMYAATLAMVPQLQGAQLVALAAQLQRTGGVAELAALDLLVSSRIDRTPDSQRTSGDYAALVDVQRSISDYLDASGRSAAQREMEEVAAWEQSAANVRANLERYDGEIPALLTDTPGALGIFNRAAA